MKLWIIPALLLVGMVLVSAPESDSPYSYNLLNTPTTSAQTNFTNPFDQDLNTTSNVQFNRTNVIPSAGIQESGYAYGLVGNIPIDPSLTTFYDIFQNSGSSTVSTTSALVPRVFYSGRIYNIHGIGSATKALTFHNVPDWNFYNSSNITSMQSYFDGQIFDGNNGYTRVPYLASYVSSPSFYETGGRFAVTEFDAFAVGNGESGTSNVMNWFTGTPEIDSIDIFEFDTQINTLASIPEMRGLVISPSFGVFSPTSFKGIDFDDISGPTTTEGIKSELSASGSSKAFINHTGTAPSYHEGNFTFGDSQFFTAPNGSVYDCGVSNTGTWSCSHT